MLFISLFLQFQHGIMIFAMSYARIAILFYMLPILGERVLSGLVIKNTLIALVIIGLWPYLTNELNPEQGWLIILVKELIIGLFLAMTLCIPFWVVLSIGEFIDNQRGATLSDSIDPVNGGQSSVLSGFLNFSFGAIFFSCGGVQILMDALIHSYHVFPRGASIEKLDFYKVGLLLVIIVKNAIILASPVLLIMMITELLLGIFARYCPQLNPFSLSLTIKSFLAFLIFLLYGFTALSSKPLNIFPQYSFSNFILN